MKPEYELIKRHIGDRRNQCSPPRGKSPKTATHKLVRAMYKGHTKKTARLLGLFAELNELEDQK